MLEKTQNYEEAKKIIVDAMETDYEKNELKKSRLCALLVMGIGVSAAIGMGIVNQDPVIAMVSFPPALMVVYPFTFPYKLRKKTIEMIHNGEYFKDKSEEKIIDIANSFVDEYNDYEEKQARTK